jgi:outer membrane lipoprotein-sorting protein
MKQAASKQDHGRSSFGARAVFITVFGAMALAVTIQGRETASHFFPNRTHWPADEFSTLYGHFRRTFAGHNSADTTEGEFYYLGPGKMHVEVSYPLRQIMVIEANVTTLYYPLARTAFRLESDNPAILPLVPGLMAAIRPDYGLTELGFQLSGQKMRGDTVIAIWSHAKARKKIGNFTIAESKDRLAYTLYVSPDSLTRNKTNFSDYVEAGGIFFPTRIASVIQSPAGKAVETVVLSRLKVNLEIPPQIANFKIPEDVTVTKRKW